MKATQSSLPLAAQPADVAVSDGAAPVAERPARTEHAGLAWTLVRTDFKVRYHGTLSGFAWALLKPASMFLVLMGVFSFLFTDPGYKLQLIIGLFLWDFFAESTKVGMGSLHAKAFLFTKMRVPLWVLVLSSIANPLITLGVFGVVIVAFLTAAGQPPTPQGIALFAAYCGALTLLVLDSTPPAVNGERRRVAAELARVVSREVRETDLLSLSDEGQLSIVLLDADLPNSMRVVERLLTRLEHHDFASAAGLAVGAACCPTHVADLESLRRAAQTRPISPRREPRGQSSAQ